ncbi:hypothetical protein H4V96_003516 [Janthinobacterium sp. CG_23.4]|nr:hypothetical protein [Janthinobacterium sp. CG_23.4]
MHDGDRFPIARRTAPALRAIAFRNLIHVVARGQKGRIKAGVALHWRHEADGAVAVFFVTPYVRIDVASLESL